MSSGLRVRGKVPTTSLLGMHVSTDWPGARLHLPGPTQLLRRLHACMQGPDMQEWPSVSTVGDSVCK